MTYNTPPNRPRPRSNAAREALNDFLWWVLRLTNLGLLFMIAGFAGLLLGSYSGIAQVVPKIGDLTSVQPGTGSRFVSSDGQVLATIAVENRQPVTLDRIPTKLQQAVIATEDREFYKHMGVDPRGIARAVLTDVRAGGRRQGGSTITQQLARNLYLTQKRTFSRKLAEMVLAMQLERAYTKPEILELYLNQIYFGEGAYGVQVAAHTYFGKDVSKLDEAECAMLAGAIRAPEKYSPFVNAQRAHDRRNQVLANMAEEKYLTPEEANDAKDEPLKVVTNHKAVVKTNYLAPWFVAYAMKEFVRQYGEDALYQGNYTIQTTLNYEMQKAAEEAIQDNFDHVHRYGAEQMALVSLDSHSGAVRAMVGGVDWNLSQYNITTQGLGRQPGSAFKPFVYTAALLQGDTPNTMVSGRARSFKGASGTWTPHNYESHEGGGRYTYRVALANSYNTCAVNVAAKVGIDSVIDTATKMGIPNYKMPHYLPTAIGAASVTPLEMASAFSIFATGGMRTEPYSIERVVDAFGRTVDEHKVVTWRVLDESIAATMRKMMHDVLTYGTAGSTGRRVNSKFDASGKTGTSSDFKDAWFIGYTNDLSTAVWSGKKDYSEGGMHHGAAGGVVSAPVWADFMLKAEPIAVASQESQHTGPVEVIKPPAPHREARPKPDRDTENAPDNGDQQNPEAQPSDQDVVQVTICSESGPVAGPNCPNPVEATYNLREGDKPPTKVCDIHNGPNARTRERPTNKPREGRTGDKVTLSVCAITGMLATPYCPVVVNRTFNVEDAPTQTCTRHGRRGAR